MRCRRKALRVIRQMCTELASRCSQTADAKGQRHTFREFACTHLARVISPRFDVRQYTADGGSFCSDMVARNATVNSEAHHYPGSLSGVWLSLHGQLEQGSE